MNANWYVICLGQKMNVQTSIFKVKQKCKCKSKLSWFQETIMEFNRNSAALNMYNSIKEILFSSIRTKHWISRIPKEYFPGIGN